MADLIVQVLGVGAWATGVLLLVVMAALPLIERFAQARPASAANPASSR